MRSLRSTQRKQSLAAAAAACSLARKPTTTTTAATATGLAAEICILSLGRATRSALRLQASKSTQTHTVVIRPATLFVFGALNWPLSVVSSWPLALYPFFASGLNTSCQACCYLLTSNFVCFCAPKLKATRPKQLSSSSGSLVVCCVRACLPTVYVRPPARFGAIERRKERLPHFVLCELLRVCSSRCHARRGRPP